MYAKKAELEHATFVPFAMETYGGFGKCAREFVNQLAEFARSGSALWTPADVRRSLQREIHDALMLGNLQMLTGELSRCHRAPPPRRPALPPIVSTRDSRRGSAAARRGSSARAGPNHPSAQPQQQTVQEATNPTPLLSVSVAAEGEPTTRVVRASATHAAYARCSASG